MEAQIVNEALTYKENVESKVDRIVGEFADGKISHEQFQMIYDHYSNQLHLAEQAIETGDMTSLVASRNFNRTIDVRNAYSARAQGAMIYHHANKRMIETLGKIDVPYILMEPMLRRFGQLISQEKFVDRYMEKITPQQWIVYAPGRLTTLVVQFEHEPSQTILAEAERVHRHFERANATVLAKDNFDSRHLVYPFSAMVKKTKRTD